MVKNEKSKGLDDEITVAEFIEMSNLDSNIEGDPADGIDSDSEENEGAQAEGEFI